MSGFFLFSGFVFSCITHFACWVLISNRNTTRTNESDTSEMVLLVLTGVAVNAFGYLLFR